MTCIILKFVSAISEIDFEKPVIIK
jgi:hypothetical protein